MPHDPGIIEIVPSVSLKARKLAERLLSFEASVDNAAAFGVTEKLRQPLAIFVGTAGFRALLSRALALAGDEVRWLKAVHVDGSGSLEGLDEASVQISADQIARGEAALIARLIGLLVTFIGAPLTTRLLQDVWPEISPDDLDSGTEENDG